MKKILLLLISLILTSSIYATFVATVVDEDNEPIIAATIRCIDCGDSFTTDAEGQFDYSQHIDHTVEISYIGKKTQRIVIKRRPNLTIILPEDDSVIE